MQILPLFTSHYSLGCSILTLEEAGTSTPGGPDSIFDICIENKLTDLFLVDNSISSFLSAYTNAIKANVNLHFGLKLTCCADIEDKSEASLNTEHQVIVWLLNSKQEGKDLYHISTKAATDGFYYRPRISEKVLKEMWTDNLALSIPFYGSFIAQNLLRFSACVFNCSFCKPTFFVEKSQLPFDPLIEKAVRDFAKDRFEVVPTRSIYYKNHADFDAYQTMRCIADRKTLTKPEQEHMSSDCFCLEDWKKNNV